MPEGNMYSLAEISMGYVRSDSGSDADSGGVIIKPKRKVRRRRVVRRKKSV